ncbi:MAG: CoA ester lyase [Ignavibacteriaceae bacterium]|nr:CoA ester lyase [Ignavibacteriaceae bacterium]
MLQKSLGLDADIVMLDLEDSVPVDKKAEGRKKIVDFLKTTNNSGKTFSVRVNEINSAFALHDILDLLENCSDKIDSLIIPKVEDVSEIHFVDKLINSVSLSKGEEIKTGIEVSIESPKGLAKVNELAAASMRNISLVFGIADFSSALQMRMFSLSGHGENEKEDYPGHKWHYVLSSILIAARANGLSAIDAPFGNFGDLDGLRESAKLSASLGFDGKWAIHPSQISIINEVFSPTQEQINFALQAKEYYELASKEGKGSVSVDGRMVDGATYRLALKTLELVNKKR